ncbi:hypothetical protein ISN44_As06g028940 [Arabidopsis suecica]|uniref:C2H2-type domain-containing protein n=1 Tax=Arabidopsis suecica TaxID=45249 RepID=A0A8T2CGX4_ARASU|nr:hypothetical protein ISN44_As06g028940 [Arabidopsis suecica]
MEPSSFLKRAKDLFCKSEYIKALEIIEENINLFQRNDMVEVNYRQGSILKALAEETENMELEFIYMLGSVECFSRIPMGSVYTASLLFKMAEQTGADLYYKKSLNQAKDCLFRLRQPEFEDFASEFNSKIEELEYIIETSETRIAVSKIRVWEQSKEPNEQEETKNSRFDSVVNGLRSYWMGLDVEIKRNFMKVITADLKANVKITDGKEGQQALEQILTYARKNGKWKLWICRTCLTRFSNPEECTNHLEQEHVAEFKPKDMLPQRISDVWASQISVGGWEPVNAAAAVEMIKNQLEDVKKFSYENGWSKDWPLTVGEERSKLLKEIKQLLVLFCDVKILSCSIRDRVMDFVAKKLEVSEDSLTYSRLVETPQGICLLECHELSQVLAFLRRVKCERDDGTDVVRRAVDSFCNATRYREKLDFDSDFSTLLLDKRLLQGKVSRYDDEGTVNVFDPNVHYAKAHASGDDYMSWLSDYSSGHTSFRFPRPIRAHNLGIWVAVMRAVQFTCRSLATKYAKKSQLLDHETALSDVRKLCSSEDDRRKNLKTDEWKNYKSVLCDRCEDGDAAKTFSDAVGDVLNKSSELESENLSDEDVLVLESIKLLKSEVNNKVALIDSKILLIENTRISLLSDLTKLAVFDYRYYIHHPLRVFLLAHLMNRSNDR